MAQGYCFLGDDNGLLALGIVIMDVLAVATDDGMDFFRLVSGLNSVKEATFSTASST